MNSILILRKKNFAIYPMPELFYYSWDMWSILQRILHWIMTQFTWHQNNLGCVRRMLGSPAFMRFLFIHAIWCLKWGLWQTMAMYGAGVNRYIVCNKLITHLINYYTVYIYLTPRSHVVSRNKITLTQHNHLIILSKN